MINKILGWVPLIVFSTLHMTGSDVDPAIMIALPSFSLGIFTASLFAGL